MSFWDNVSLPHQIQKVYCICSINTSSFPLFTISTRVSGHISFPSPVKLMGGGWTQSLVDDTIDNPVASRPCLNKATGQDATAYFRSDGSYVVRDNATGEIIQVSNRNDPGWIPDSAIQNPYKP